MTIQNLESELLILNTKILDIFEQICYGKTHDLSHLAYSTDCPDEVMKYFEYQSIFYHLDFIHSLFSYLQKPTKHIGIVERTTQGRYKIGNITLHVGDVIETLDTDMDSGMCYWRPRIIKSSSLDLIGITARFRGNKPPHIH